MKVSKTIRKSQFIYIIKLCKQFSKYQSKIKFQLSIKDTSISKLGYLEISIFNKVTHLHLQLFNEKACFWSNFLKLSKNQLKILVLRSFSTIFHNFRNMPTPKTQKFMDLYGLINLWFEGYSSYNSRHYLTTFSNPKSIKSGMSPV